MLIFIGYLMNSPSEAVENSKQDRTSDIATGAIGVSSGITALSVSDSATTLGKIAKPLGWTSIALGGAVLLKTFFSKTNKIPNEKSDISR